MGIWIGDLKTVKTLMEQSGGVVVEGVLCFSLSFSIIDLKSVLSIILDVRGENREDPDL